MQIDALPEGRILISPGHVTHVSATGDGVTRIHFVGGGWHDVPYGLREIENIFEGRDPDDDGARAFVGFG